MASLDRLLLSHVRRLHSKSEPIVVVAATRTPCGRFQGQLSTLSAWQLGQIAVEASIKRSAVPLEQIHHIFMNEAEPLQHDNVMFTHFFKKVKYTSVRIGENVEMDSFLMALEFVKLQPQAVVVAGGFVSTTNDQNTEYSLGDTKNELSKDYVKKNVDKFTKSQSEDVFDSELVPLRVPKQQGESRILEDIYQDEISTQKTAGLDGRIPHSDEASAVVLTSARNAQELELSPLAVIEDIEYLQSTADILPRSLQCLEKLFTKADVQPYKIKHWEVDNGLSQLIHHLEKDFNVNSNFINPHGGAQILGLSALTSVTHLLTHICHAPNQSKYGCIISNSHHKTTALIVQKLFHTLTSQRLPVITLYTKNPCPLCDILIEELEFNFCGEYELEKIFIDSKENVRFLRLYRYDIPVVFLNNQFLCMHRLNHKLLRKRLNLLKNLHTQGTK